MIRSVLARGWGRPSLIALCALAVYLPGFWWGAPHATAGNRVRSWGTDDETPLGPIAEIRNMFAPQPNRNLGYPLGYGFIVVAAYSPYLAYLKLSGGLRGGGPVYPYGLQDPVTALATLSHIAHLVTVFLGVIMVVALYDTAKTWFDRRTATIAAAGAVVIYPMLYYARTGNVDVPMLSFIALALAAFARCVKHGLSVRRALWLGAFVGFALGIKEAAFGVFLPMPFVVLARHRSGPASWRSTEFWRAPIAGLAVALLAFAVSSGLLLDPQRFLAHIGFTGGRVNDLAPGQGAVQLSFPYTIEGHAGMALRLWGYLNDALSLPVLVLALIGLVWTARREPVVTTLGLLLLCYLAEVFVILRWPQLRYVLPASLLLIPFAARATTLAWDSGHPLLRWPALMALSIGFGFNLLRGVELTHGMVRDSRYAAGEWFRAHTAPGQRVEFFGASQKIPWIPAGVITFRTADFRGMFVEPGHDEANIQTIISGWEARRPEFLIVMPDHTSLPGMPHDATLPPRLYQRLLAGAVGYRLVTQFQTPPLFSWLRMPPLDYPTVNPPIRVFERDSTMSGND